jgi:hypothetical protein
MPAHTGRPDQAELSRTPAIPARPTLPVDRIHIGAMPRVRRGSHNRPQARRPRHAGKHGVADVGRRPSQKPRRVTTLSVCKAARYRTATGPRGPAACPKPAVGEPPSAHVAGRCQRWGDYRQRDWSSLSGPAAAPSQVGHSPVRRAGRRYTGSPPPAALPRSNRSRAAGCDRAYGAVPRPCSRTMRGSYHRRAWEHRGPRTGATGCEAGGRKPRRPKGTSARNVATRTAHQAARHAGKDARLPPE